jgi:protein-tyrosine-phosphatase
MLDDPRVIFVCEHGAAKSIIAAAYFNELAKQRGLHFKAVARGTDPDPEVSEPTVQGLSKDGLSPIEQTPHRLSKEDLQSTRLIISFCELPSEYIEKVTTEQWDEIPPVSEDYDKARDAILHRLNNLLDNLRSSS